MSTPYIGFSNATLAKQLDAKAGDLVSCSQCGNRHPLVPVDDGSTILLFYKCGDASFLGALAGKLIVGVKSDMSGES